MQGRATVPTSLAAIAVRDAKASVPEEPGAVIPHAGICAGQPGNWLSYRDKRSAGCAEERHQAAA